MQLDIYGIRVLVEGDADAQAALRVHFSTFLAKSPGSGEAEVSVELRRAAPTLPSDIRLKADQVLERGVVYNSGPLTWVDHHGLALTHYDFARERGRVTALDPNDLVELSYLMIHSRVGVLLERRGFVRVHALGVAERGRAAVVVTPSGGGKSRLALGVLRRTQALLLGDDMVLIDRAARAYPFPHPIGLSRPDSAVGLGRAAPFVRRQHPTKWLLELDSLEHRLAVDPHPVMLLALYRRVSSPPSRVLPATRGSAAAALFRDMVVGLGLPQVLELVARQGAMDLPKLLPTGVKRSLAAFTLLKQARPIVLEVCDPEEAAEVLVRELERS